jgi:TetR/AcrR family transcriptional regulator, transcriptional repressor for nem operon
MNQTKHPNDAPKVVERRSRRNGRATIDRLLEVTLRLLWSKNYGAVSVDDICEQAKIRKGSFYHFFPSKCALTVAAIQRYAADSKAGLDEIFSADRAPLDRLAMFCQSMHSQQAELCERAGHVCGCPLVSLGSELTAVEGKIREASVELGRRMVRYFESAVRDAVGQGAVDRLIDPEWKAEELNALLVGFVTQARLRNSVDPLLRLWPAMQASLGVRSGERRAMVPLEES